MMGSVRSVQLAQGYTHSPERGRDCGRCRHLTVVADARSRRLPYCKLGGFNTWRDYGCAKWTVRDDHD